MINIFQFLKQGTSLSRGAHNSNQQLEDHIIAKSRCANLTYSEAGKFHQSDSQEDPDPDTYDEKKLKQHTVKKERNNRQFLHRHHIRVEGTDIPPALANFTKIIK